jgi:hypothetical protein
MRSWRGLGLVVSVLWLVGFGVWLWISSVGERPEWYALQLQRCYSSSEIKREKLQPERYDSQLADVSREYQSCIVQAKTIFDGQMDELRSHVRKIMALNAGVLAAIWLLVFLGVPVGRWIALRFVSGA